MKKILWIMACVLLVGCTSHQTKNIGNEEKTDADVFLELHDKWVGEYVKGDVVIRFYESDDDDEETALPFRVELGEKGFGDYAYFEEGTDDQAIYDTEEDGYTLEFTIDGDKLFVEESGGSSYLDTDLSGEYIRQGG